jgi:phage terminase large subunit
MWFSWNPFSEKDPIDKFLRKEKPKEAIVVEAQWYDNPWFPDELMIDLEYDKRRDPDRYKHIWLGQYDLKTNRRVFNRWVIGDQEEIAKVKRRNSMRPYYGSDFGFSNDPTVLIEIYVDEDARKVYITAEAYKIGCEIDETPALFKTIEGCENWPITADSARPETISYLKRFGFPRIKSAKKGPNSVIEGVKFLQSYDIIIHPDCVHTIDEFTLYSWKVDKLTEEILPELEDEKNHVIDATRYAVERLRRAKLGGW